MNNRFNLIKSFKAKPETVRKRHLRNAIYLTLGLSFLLILFTSQSLIKARTERGEQLLFKKIELVESEVMKNFEMLENDIKLISKWGKSGVFDLDDDLNNLDNKIIPIVEEYPFVLSFCLVSSDSSYYTLNKAEENWQSFLARIDLESWRYFARPDTTYIPDSEFLDMIQSGTLYSIVFGSESGSDEPTMGTVHPITDPRAGSSKTVYFENDNVDNLAIFNIDNEFIESNISEFKISEHGQVYLTSRYDYSLLHHEEPDDLSFKDTTSSENQVYDRRKILELASESWYNMTTEEPFVFRYKGENWWGIARKPLDDQMARWVMVTLPVNELFVELDQERNEMIVFTIIILIAGSLLFGILVKLYNRPLPFQPSSAELQEDEILLKLISEGESDNLEFKSTLRWNLKANKHDINIERSVLKTLVAYMNSEGGTLLVGVEDNGNILGIEPDKFPNEDKYMLHLNNLIKQHIGLEFTKHIHYGLIYINKKNVLRVDCEKSNDPAFLCYQDDEDFYIRTGPASRKLSSKKALSYLMNKNKGK
jgi:Schlafen, AlbA_2